jgi:hypothetical protein
MALARVELDRPVDRLRVMKTFRFLVVAALATVVMACGSAASGSPPPTSPSPSPIGSTFVDTPEAAWAAVVAHEPRFGGIARKDPQLIGQSAWYEVQPASGVGAFVVRVTVGWGDCQAGCINRHVWTIAVLPDGTINFVGEEGPSVPVDILVGLGALATGMTIVATSGPGCPVESNPPDPACAPGPVVGAKVVVKDGKGVVVAEGTTGLTGTLDLAVSPGLYTVEASPVEGLVGTPELKSVNVTDGARAIVDLGYDTGIR